MKENLLFTFMATIGQGLFFKNATLFSFISWKKFIFI